MKTPNLPSCILFDLDGTIGNTLPLCLAAFRQSVEPFLNEKLSDAAIISRFGPTEGGMIRSLVGDHYEEAMESYLIHYQRLHVGYSKPFDRIPEILDYLRFQGSFVGLVTGKGAKSTAITLDHYGMTHSFDSIKTGSDEGPVKGKRICEILAEHDYPKDAVLYVGDAPSDIDDCRSVGVKIASAAWAETADVPALQAKSPDYLFRSTTDFENFLKGRINADKK